jgi:hypothetical protein
MLVSRDLDASFPFPDTPGVPPGTIWSARRAVLELIATTARYAARADLIRRALDDTHSSATAGPSPLE